MSEWKKKARGNPPDRRSHGFLPREKQGEAGCHPRLGGLPKGPQIWPGGGWHGPDWPMEKAGIPPGNWAAKGGPSAVLRHSTPLPRPPVCCAVPQPPSAPLPLPLPHRQLGRRHSPSVSSLTRSPTLGFKLGRWALKGFVEGREGYFTLLVARDWLLLSNRSGTER